MDTRATGSKRTAMPYPFPSTRQKCLLCHWGCGGRWKGYFVRRCLCGVTGFDGLIAIHVGHCKTQHCDFSYFPDFLIPGRRLSRPSWDKFVDDFQRTRTIAESIDELVEGIETSDFTMALSSAYNVLYGGVRALRINHEALGILAPMDMSVYVFYDLPKLAARNLFSFSDFPWHARQNIVLHPP